MATERDTANGRIIPRAIAAFCALLFGTSQVLAQAAGWMPPAKQQFFNGNGQPLVGGTVQTLVPNTTNPKNSWLDPFETTPNANPVVLDAAGRAIIFGQGNYRQIVKDSAGNLQWDSQTGTLGSATTGSSINDTAPVGTIMPFGGFTIPTNWVLAFGQTLSRSTFSQLMSALTIVSTTATCTQTSTTVGGFASTAQMAVGEPIEASCLPSNTTISSITNGTTIVVSQAASTGGTVTATVFPWGNGDGSTTFTLPDLRGRVLAGADAMGGTAASRLTSTFYGAVASAPAVTGGSQSTTISTTTTANVAVTGATSIIGLAGANPAQRTIQPTSTINYIIKTQPFATGLGGVTSFGGMTGDIICGPSMNCRLVSSIPTVDCAAASASQLGCVIPDNSTIKVNGSGFLIATGASASTSVGVGVTAITGGSSGNVEYNNGGLFGEMTTSGSGTQLALTNGPTFTGTVATSSLTNSSLFNATGTFQINSHTMTFPPSAQTLAALTLADQTASGGANVTSGNLGSVSSGTLTIDCGLVPLQYATVTGSFTLAPPSNDGSCDVMLIQTGSGVVSFSGSFTVGANVGDAISNSNTNKQIVHIERINGTSTYFVKALQ